MKMLTVFALLCAMVALTTAAETIDEVEGFMPPGNGHYTGSPSSKGAVGNPSHWVCVQRKSYCLSLRSNLASVRSTSEYRVIQRLTGYRESWIGGTDASKEGTWLWSDGTCFYHTKWCFREPNNDHNQDCLQINRGVFKWWDDMWCDAHLPSVCAKKI